MFPGVEALPSAGAFIQGRELGVVALMRPIFWGFSWPVGFEVVAGFGVARRSRAPTRRSSRRSGIAVVVSTVPGGRG